MSVSVCGSTHRAEAGGCAGILQGLGERRADQCGIGRGGRLVRRLDAGGVNPIECRTSG